MLHRETRPGYTTTEFWLVLVANILTQAGALNVPERYKWLVTLATVTGYALSRGLAKQGATDPTDGLSEGVRPVGFEPEQP